MAYRAIDIANKIIAKTDSENGETISNLKLQKMLYYMQGFHYAFFESPLFEEDIVAWNYGPVVTSVYDAFRYFGKDAIKLDEGVEIISLSEDEEDVFNQVYEVYSQYSAIRLMNMTHDEMPWKSTEQSKIISPRKLKAFFSTLIES